MIELSPAQLLRLFVGAWDRDHKPKRKSAKPKRRRLDPHDWVRTPKKPKAKSW